MLAPPESANILCLCISQELCYLENATEKRFQNNVPRHITIYLQAFDQNSSTISINAGYLVMMRMPVMVVSMMIMVMMDVRLSNLSSLNRRKRRINDQ